ncbi:MAG: galactose oxidase-like domain-containing protein [Bacteroidia bacterium]
MKKTILLSALLVISLAAKSQFNVTGTVQDQPFTQFMSGARVTLFNADTTFFRETRVNGSGNYSFTNIPANVYSLGVSYLNKQYQQVSLNVSANTTHNFSLLPETQTGQWNVIVQSPEPLGGTNLGALMPDGKIFYCHETVDPFYFDPAINDTISAPGSGSVQGCVGPILTNDGKLWFIGGALVPTYGPGSKKVKTFNQSNGSWQFQPDMLDWRWYPSLIQLPSSKILIFGGGGLNNPVRTNTSEIYNPATGTSVFTDTLAIGNEVSPTVVLYNGKVLMTHRPPQLFNPATNQWSLAGAFVQSPRTPNGDHSDCELVLMPDGEAIAIGYKSFTAGIYGTFIERYNPVTDSWSLGTSILPIRSRAKTVLLPDKKILVMGGYKENPSDTTSTNQYGYMNLCDLYSPATDSWRRLKRLNYQREYHCNAILVPDGRIIAVGGEGQPGNEPPFSVIEAFKPPYLFRGVRPQIINLNQTSFARNASINFDFQKTDSVTEVILMSNALVTHFMNSGNNRYLTLNFTRTGNHITATLPSDSVTLLPGFYMLFAMVDDIPSVAKIIKIENSVCIPPSALITPAGPTTFCSGGSVVLNAPVANNRAYQWKKGGVNIPGATLSSYTAATGGTYKVTVTNTSTGCSKTTATGVVITLKSLPAATINPSGTITFCAGQSALLTANNGTGYTYKWKKNGSYISGASSMTYTVTTAGKYRVEVTNGNGCSKTSSVNTVVVPCRTANLIEDDVFIRPNPAQNSFTIALPSVNFNVTISDETGRKVFEQKSVSGQTEIDSKDFPNGIYFIDAITSKEKIYRRKIIINK